MSSHVVSYVSGLYTACGGRWPKAGGGNEIQYLSPAWRAQYLSRLAGVGRTSARRADAACFLHFGQERHCAAQYGFSFPRRCRQRLYEIQQSRRLVAFSHPTQPPASIHRRSFARQHFPEKIRHRAHGGAAAHVFVHHQIQRCRAGGRGFVCAQCHCLQAVCG